MTIELSPPFFCPYWIPLLRFHPEIKSATFLVTEFSAQQSSPRFGAWGPGKPLLGGEGGWGGAAWAGGMWASGQLWKAGPLQSLEHRFPAEEHIDASRLLGRPPDVGNTQIHIRVMQFHINMMLNRDSYACQRQGWGNSERGHQ